MKGFSPTVRAIIIEREGGRCACCGVPISSGDDGYGAAAQIHHRRPRGMGGASYRGATNLAANGIALAPACHRWIELNRPEALKRGWLVQQWDLPAEKPLLYRGVWVRLDDDGSIIPCGGTP